MRSSINLARISEEEYLKKQNLRNHCCYYTDCGRRAITMVLHNTIQYCSSETKLSLNFSLLLLSLSLGREKSESTRRHESNVVIYEISHANLGAKASRQNQVVEFCKCLFLLRIEVLNPKRLSIHQKRL